MRPAKKRPRRAYGSGSIYPKDGRWVAQIAVPGPEGQRRYVTRWRRSYGAASDALDGLRDLYGPDRGQDDRQTLSRYLAAWLERVKVSRSPATHRAYESQVRLHISPVLGGLAVGDVRRVDVQRLVSTLQAAKLAPGSIAVALRALGVALNEAVRDGILRTSPMVGLARPPQVREPVEAMTAAEASAILDAMAATPYGALTALLLGSGMRIGEAVALDWRDLDLDAGTARVRRAKTRAGIRTVPLAPFAIAALTKHRAAARRVGLDAPVFLGYHGDRMTAATVADRLPTILVKAGLRRRHAHELRHGHATLLRAMGLDIRLIADQLGHADPALTARVYAHVLPGEQRSALDRMSALVVPADRVNDRATG